jgi:predicted transcriptional regulator
VAPVPVLNNRILNLLAKHEALTVKDLMAHYNAAYLTRYDRSVFSARLAKLMAEGKVYRQKDEHAEVGQRYLKYFTFTKD